MRHLDNVSILD